MNFLVISKESVFDRKVGEFSGKPDELLRTNIATKPLEQQELRQVLEAAQSGLLNGITRIFERKYIFFCN